MLLFSSHGMPLSISRSKPESFALSRSNTVHSPHWFCFPEAGQFVTEPEDGERRGGALRPRLLPRFRVKRQGVFNRCRCQRTRIHDVSCGIMSIQVRLARCIWMKIRLVSPKRRLRVALRHSPTSIIPVLVLLNTYCPLAVR